MMYCLVGGKWFLLWDIVAFVCIAQRIPIHAMETSEVCLCIDDTPVKYHESFATLFLGYEIPWHVYMKILHAIVAVSNQLLSALY